MNELPKGVVIRLGEGIGSAQPPPASFTQAKPPKRQQTTRSSYRLFPRPRAVVEMVNRFQLVTSSQVRRVHFPTGTVKGREERCRATLARLVDLGYLRCLRRASEDGENVYTPAKSTARIAFPHTTDITELYARLMEYHHGGTIELVAFDPEKTAVVRLGGVELKPDAYIDIRTATGRYRYFIEVDWGNEYGNEFRKKFRRYAHAYDHWDEDRDGKTMPSVLWLVHDEDRRRFIDKTINQQSHRRLFTCMMFDAAPPFVTS